MFSYSLFSDLLIISGFFMKSSCSFFAFTSAFAIVFIVLEAVRFLTSWLAIAMLFCVWEELDSSRFENRVVLDLRFFFEILISYKFRK
jgi:hypothetical protein